MINPPARPLTFTELFGAPPLAEKGLLVPPAAAVSAHKSSTGIFLLTALAIGVLAIAIYQYEAGRKEERSCWQQRREIDLWKEQYQ